MIETLVIGGGPAALAVSLMLRCHGLDDGLRVVDPSGQWLSAWHQRFAAQDIPHLRSPAVHHPHPEPFALLAFAGDGDLVPAAGTTLPTTAAFARFCEHTIAGTGLSSAVEQGAAAALTVLGPETTRVTLVDGRCLVARRVVLAANRRRPVLPDGLRDVVGHPCIRVGDEADVRLSPPGARILVLGGGLSAAHLALGAVRRGADVTMVARRRLRVRRYDTHPTWLGMKKRRPFELEPDPWVRRRAIDHARGGGSIPHRFRRAVEHEQTAGRLVLLERRRPIGTAPTAQGALAVRLDDGQVVTADQIWCATGGDLDVGRDPLCRDVVRRSRVEVVRGLPFVAEDLSFPGTSVHLVGFGAALRLGPTAGNLVGHRRAALRVAAAIRGDDPAHADRVRTGRRACPRDHDASRLRRRRPVDGR